MIDDLIPKKRNRRLAGVLRTATVAAAVATSGALLFDASRAAFSSSTSSNGSSAAAGTVVVGDDDADGVMFNLTNMKPGDTASRCVNVTYSGSLPADVKLYGSIGGTGLATYLDTVVEAGSGAAGGAAMSCTGFTASTSLHTGTLAAFGTARTNFANGLAGFAGATNGSTKSYKVTITLQDNNLAQAKNATAGFTWEAQNI